MDPTSCDFSTRDCFKYLKAKYWIYWTVFNKYFAPRPYLMDPTSCDFSPRNSFKYLEAKY